MKFGTHLFFMTSAKNVKKVSFFL